jgi:hypothetical protein
MLEALEQHKAESLKAFQTAKSELTKEREEAEGRTTAAREALSALEKLQADYRAQTAQDSRARRREAANLRPQ